MNHPSHSEAETRSIAAGVAADLRAGAVLLLSGDLGAGKTAFVRGLAEGLGIDPDDVTSPTFTLVHSYEIGRSHLHHADVYRLERISEVADLAIGELLEGGGIVLVEWGDVIAASLGDHLEVRLAWVDVAQPDERVVTVRAIGRGWAARWDRLTAALAPWRSGSETAC